MKKNLRRQLISAFIAVFCSDSLWASGSRPPQSPVRVGSVQLPSAGLIDLAEAHGFFKEEKLNVVLYKYPLGKLALNALASNEIDLAGAYNTPVIEKLREGFPMRILSTLHYGSENTSLIALKNSGISKPGDLNGKKVGFSRKTTAEYFLQLFIQRHGLKKNSIKIVDLSPDQLADALKEKKVDAVISGGFLARQTRSHLNSSDFIIFNLDIYTEFSLLVGSIRFLQERQDEVSRFLSALLKAERYYLKNPKKTIQEICKIQELDEKACEAAYLPPNDFHLRIGLSNILLASLEMESSFSSYNLDFETLIEANPLQKICQECVTLFWNTEK